MRLKLSFSYFASLKFAFACFRQVVFTPRKVVPYVHIDHFLIQSSPSASYLWKYCTNIVLILQPASHFVYADCLVNQHCVPAKLYTLYRDLYMESSIIFLIHVHFVKVVHIQLKVLQQNTDLSAPIFHLSSPLDQRSASRHPPQTGQTQSLSFQDVLLPELLHWAAPYHPRCHHHNPL